MVYFSGTTLGFYLSELKERYDKTGNWPRDAVALTAIERDTYWRKNPPAGYVLGADEGGRPAWLQKPKPSAPDQRAVAKAQIDTAAGSARARYVSAGQLIEEEYRLALQQAQQWRLAGNPADDVPQAVQDWADAADMTVEEAAMHIEQTDAAWQQILLSIRQVRLTGKAAINAAQDDADFKAVARPYIDQLNAMQP